ncbi:hypothetical protein FQN60_004431 [Etheostoma spectabile]|uniref:Uncharacterized protein n=1 Tax=Etheostoma spectabile TaxID=54343 RepID=A0A5J5CVE2_9PERO|nr:hypothetical protein FQN60_004431 [Etheostoma spectabile]
MQITFHHRRVSESSASRRIWKTAVSLFSALCPRLLGPAWVWTDGNQLKKLCPGEEDGSGSDTTRVTGDDALRKWRMPSLPHWGGVVEEDGTSGVPAGGIGRSGTKDGASHRH